MKLREIKKVTAAALAAAVLSGYGFTVSADNGIPETGDKTNGFTVTDVRRSEALDSDIITFEHDKTGALVMCVSNDDINRAFQISFRTPAYDDTGLTHVFEHSALSGNEKYPSSTLAFKIMQQIYCTYMNATTAQNNTNYTMASLSEEQLYNLADYYMSSAFEPLIYSDPSIKEREAWHYELDSPEAELTLAGTVYSEMQGAVSDITTAAYNNYKRTMYPGSPASHISGGDPAAIPELTNEDMIEYHDEYYVPSNSVTYLYGDLDYEPFLALFDSYFSKYEKREVNIDLSVEADAPMYTERTYEVPVSADSDTENGSVIVYAFECADAEPKDMAALFGMCYALGASKLTELAGEYLPGAAVSCSPDIIGGDPAVVFMAKNVDPEDKDTFVHVVDTAISELGDMDGEMRDALNAQTRLSTVLGLESGSIGVNMAMNTASVWGATGDPYYWFDMQELALDPANYEYSGVVSKYMNASSRRSVTVTVPKAGLLERQNAELAASLAEKKAAMTPEEINETVEATAAYKSGAAGNEELDARLIEQINCVDISDFTETRKEYEIADETSESGIRYISSVSGKETVGQGRIMFDISDLTEEELRYLALYDKLMFGLGTNKHDTAESLSLETMKYTSSMDTDIMTVPDDSADGFKPYLIFKWTGFTESLDDIYALADEVLFGTDLSDSAELERQISLLVNTANTNVETNSYSLMAKYAAAAGTSSAAYMNKVNGTGMIEFIYEVSELVKTDPAAVISKLDAARQKLYDKGGAVSVFAGTRESIAANKAAAESFFADMPARERADVDYGYLKVPYENTALPINSNVNYNGIYLPYDKAGTEESGKLDVLFALISDAYLVPQLRNKHNIYGTYTDASDGITILSYRDPGIAETFEEYGGIAEYLRSGAITQDTVDNYIKNVYSSYIQPHGELSDAYWAADDYMSGKDNAYYSKLIADARSTTVGDIRGYADVFDRWYNEGMWFTSGSAEQINANARLYDRILGSEPETVIVTVDGTRLETPVAPYISNDITMIPMRSIFEALGAEVEWDEGTRTVTARRNGAELILTIDSELAILTAADGSINMLRAESPAVIVEDHTMIPARLASEALGCNVEWDADAKTVSITQAAS